MYRAAEDRVPTLLADGGVSVRIYPPQARLQSYVTFFYFVEAAAPLTDFLYPEWGNVRFALSGTWRVQMPGFHDPALHLLPGSPVRPHGPARRDHDQRWQVDGIRADADRLALV